MAKRTRNPGAGGAVDFDAVKPPEPEIVKPGYWRVLRNRKSGVLLKVFAYFVPMKGPWVGYTEITLNQAPCDHCGRSGHLDRLHVCPGYYLGEGAPPVCAYDGLKTDDGEHVCVGRPSMSYHGLSRFSSEEWIEMVASKPAPLVKKRG